jgi:hypothetical protein
LFFAKNERPSRTNYQRYILKDIFDYIQRAESPLPLRPERGLVSLECQP